MGGITFRLCCLIEWICPSMYSIVERMLGAGSEREPNTALALKWGLRLTSIGWRKGLTSFLLQIQIPVLSLARRPCSVMEIPTSRSFPSRPLGPPPPLPAVVGAHPHPVRAEAGHLRRVPSDSCRWSQSPAARRTPLAGQPRLRLAGSLSPSLLCGLPQHPNQPSASEVKSCQTWRRLPAPSQVLASQRKANYKNGNFQTSVQWYSNRRLGSTQAQTAFVLFCD